MNSLKNMGLEMYHMAGIFREGKTFTNFSTYHHWRNLCTKFFSQRNYLPIELPSHIESLSMIDYISCC